MTAIGDSRPAIGWKAPEFPSPECLRQSPCGMLHKPLLRRACHRHPFTFDMTSNQPENAYMTMNSSNTIDEKVLLVTVQVKAALELIPGIMGPKDVWMPWMQDKLDAEVVSNPILSSFKDMHHTSSSVSTLPTNPKLASLQAHWKPGCNAVASLQWWNGARHALL